MPLPKEKAWFAAKRYGWGWGLPLRWQGWVALLGYLAGLMLGVVLLEPHITAIYIYIVVLSIALIALCFWKGEPPRWRWGK